MRWALVVIGFISFSCKENATQIPLTQINIDSLLDYHLSHLSGSEASLEKISTINSNVYTTEVSGSKINWKNELESFRAIRLINKPIYASAYDVEILADKKSNLLVKSWSAKRNLPVKAVKVFYLKNQTQVKRIEATTGQDNFVFSSTKELSLDFSVLGYPIADTYEISGYQKFFWEEPQYFSLKGHILIK